jgi:hypothetical protein
MTGVGSTVPPPADGVAWIAFVGLPMASGSSGRHRRNRERIRDARYCGRCHQPVGGFACVDRHGRSLVGRGAGAFALQLWSIRDWEINAQPLISLAFTAIAVTDDRARKLCAAAGLVGVADLAVAFIGGLIGPVALPVQGQGWRWVWIATFIGAVLVPFTAGPPSPSGGWIPVIE